MTNNQPLSPRPLSLRRQILRTVSLQTLLVGLVVGLFAFAATWHEIEEVYDAQLSHLAKVLQQVVEEDMKATGNVNISFTDHDLGREHKYERKMAFRIWYKGELVAQSRRAQTFKDFMAPEGYSNQRVLNRPWRFYVYEDADKGFRVETGQRMAIRYELIGQLILSLLVPFLVLLPVLILIVWNVVRKTLQPVEIVSASVDARHSDDFTPISPSGLPTEITPILLAMNRLFGRIASLFQREREFTDHAAHELRTPLAAMKTQTQVLLRRARSNQPIAAESLQNLEETIDRSTHMIDQLLAFARLQSDDVTMADVNWSEIVQNALLEIAPLSAAKKQELSADIAPDCWLKGYEPALNLMLRNILENAVKYTPENGHIIVSLAADGSLEVADTGAGISDDNKAQAFDRFVRFDKTGQVGSGLGLSMCQHVAAIHGWSIMLADAKPHGLRVIIRPHL